MASYCNKCSKDLYGTSVPEIDVYEISSSLGNGYFVNVLCEGCEMIGVQKDDYGRIFLLYPELTKEGEEVKKVSLKDWEGTSGIQISGKENSGFIGGVQVGSPIDTYKLKILKGIRSVPQMYHVIQEYTDKGTTQYSYLSEEQIREKHSIDISDKFEWIENQNFFVN